MRHVPAVWLAAAIAISFVVLFYRSLLFRDELEVWLAENRIPASGPLVRALRATGVTEVTDVLDLSPAALAKIEKDGFPPSETLSLRKWRRAVAELRGGLLGDAQSAEARGDAADDGSRAPAESMRALQPSLTEHSSQPRGRRDGLNSSAERAACEHSPAVYIRMPTDCAGNCVGGGTACESAAGHGGENAWDGAADTFTQCDGQSAVGFVTTALLVNGPHVRRALPTTRARTKTHARTHECACARTGGHHDPL